MNRKQIVESAQAYVDRYDDELSNLIPSLSRVVESKINTALKVGGQSVRAQIPMELDKEYYPLPCDFGGMRDIEMLKKDSTSVGGRSLVYLAPEEMNRLERNHEGRRHHYYTIIAGQIQINAPTDEDVLEIVYYQLVPPLVEDDDSNWLSEKHPDAYIFGLCTEISAFAKDENSFIAYDSRFKESLAEITRDDAVVRWSGPQLRVKYDGMVV